MFWVFLGRCLCGFLTFMVALWLWFLLDCLFGVVCGLVGVDLVFVCFRLLLVVWWGSVAGADLFVGYGLLFLGCGRVLVLVACGFAFRLGSAWIWV